MTILVGGAASAAGVVMFALGGALVGRSDLVDPHLGVVAGVVGVVNGLLMPLAVRLLDWAVPEDVGVARA
jgi:hypothetical protein